MPHSPLELVGPAARVPSLPQIYQKLTEALDNPRASTSHIAEVISTDAGLTARLLRLVNSAFYCFPTKVENIAHAVTLVGTQQIRDLALATSVVRLFKGIPADFVDMQAFWLHSVATGVVARLLAGLRHEVNAERYFVAGVLHDLGRLLMYETWPQEARVVLDQARRTRGPLVAIERQVFGFDHGLAGSVLLQAWGLPRALTEMTRDHHEPDEGGEDVAVLHVADIIAAALELGHSGDDAVPGLSPLAWQRLALAPAVVSSAARQSERQVAEVRRSLLSEAS
jgi:HD-like signal output (HDOD) protein